VALRPISPDGFSCIYVFRGAPLIATPSVTTGNDRADASALSARVVELEEHLKTREAQCTDLETAMRRIKDVANEQRRRATSLEAALHLRDVQYDRTLRAREKEISRLRAHLSEVVAEDERRQASAERRFSQLVKRPVRPRSRADADAVDAVRIYESEREQTAAEVRFLRREVRALSKLAVGSGLLRGTCDDSTESGAWSPTPAGV
jgi:chromosome segregation ATPase